jgi:hypothetical protein
MPELNRVGQRYQKNDRVRKKTVGKKRSLPSRIGTIMDVMVKTDKRGHPAFYYSIQWDDLKSPATHAQQVLIPLND